MILDLLREHVILTVLSRPVKKNKARRAVLRDNVVASTFELNHLGDHLPWEVGLRVDPLLGVWCLVPMDALYAADD